MYVQGATPETGAALPTAASQLLHLKGIGTMRSLYEFLAWALGFLGMLVGLAVGFATMASIGALVGLAAGVGTMLSFFSISAVISLLCSIDGRLEEAAKRAP